MSMNDSQATGSKYGSGAEGSTDPPARLEAVSVEPVASGSTENASILPDQQISAPENGQNVNPGPFSSVFEDTFEEIWQTRMSSSI